MQLGCEQVSLGAEPCCLACSQLSVGEQASWHRGGRRRGAGVHVLEVEAKPLGKLRGLRGLDCPSEKPFYQSDWMLVKHSCALLQQNSSTARHRG